MDLLNDIFSFTLANEKKTITFNEELYECFFRRNDKSDKDSYVTVYFPVSKYLSRGATFTYDSDHYLIVKNLTSENTTYRKVQAIKCNNSFKVIYGNNDIVEYNCYMNTLLDSLSTNGGGITIDSNIEFVLELNENAKRLIINKRFFCGFMGMAWAIREINYQDGLCYIYCERSVTNSNDDKENGIADRWEYEKQNQNNAPVDPDPTPTDPINTDPEPTVTGYVTTASKSNIELKIGETTTDTFTLSCTKEGVECNDNKYDIEISDEAVCSATLNGNVVTVKALAEGTATITVKHKRTLIEYQDKYPSEEVNIQVVITKIEIQQNAYMSISPVYNNTDCFNLPESSSQRFTATLNNITVTGAKWTVTYSSSLKENTDYMIAYTSGRKYIEVYNLNKSTAKGYVTLHFKENISGLTADYKIYIV